MPPLATPSGRSCTVGHATAVIGLTGGIATGKSTVSSLFRANDVPIIDADVLARKVVEPGTPALAAIVRTFGPFQALPRQTGKMERAALPRWTRSEAP